MSAVSRQARDPQPLNHRRAAGSRESDHGAGRASSCACAAAEDEENREHKGLDGDQLNLGGVLGMALTSGGEVLGRLDW